MGGIILRASFAGVAAWMKGQIISMAEAIILFNDWELVRSDITYNVLPVWDGEVIHLADTLDRFDGSMAALRVVPKMSRAAI